MNVINEEAIDIILDFSNYIEDCAGIDWGYSDNEIYCARWALDEIISLINETDEPPLIIIEEFGRKMEMFYCQKRCRIFAVAADIAEVTADLFM